MFWIWTFWTVTKNRNSKLSAMTASILIHLDQGVRSGCLWNCRSFNNFVSKCGLAKYWDEINIDNGWPWLEVDCLSPVDGLGYNSCKNNFTPIPHQDFEWACLTCCRNSSALNDLFWHVYPESIVPSEFIFANLHYTLQRGNNFLKHPWNQRQKNKA